MSNSAAEKKEQLHIPGRTKVEYLCLTSHGCGPRLNPSSLVSDRASFRRVDQEPGTPNLGQSIKGPQIQESSTFTDGPRVLCKASTTCRCFQLRICKQLAWRHSRCEQHCSWCTTFRMRGPFCLLRDMARNVFVWRH